MKSYQAPVVPNETVAALKGLVDAGGTQSELIAAMREAGLSIIPSIKLLVRFYGLPFNEAKSAVHFSTTWVDCRKSNDALHEAAFAASEEPGFRETSSGVREEVAL